MTSECGDFCLSRLTFDENIQEIFEKSELIDNKWSLKVFEVNQNLKNIELLKYLERQDQLLVNNQLITFLYHIIYSESYCVPVLYLNGYHSNGLLLSYEEMYATLNLRNMSSSTEAQFSEELQILSQQEHPYFFKPFFFLHPCKTAKWMHNTTHSAKFDKFNYTLKWLSFVFSALNISMNLKYAFELDKLKQ
jgi:ubiquitin-like-conjugating enzyme ATG10